MKKCIVISDSFKGTLSSMEICSIAKACIARRFPACQTVAIPVADGGEGTVDCFHAVCGGTKVTVPVSGPFGETVNATYLRLSGDRAVIEMASAAGLPLIGGRGDPCRATTFGVGQEILHAVAGGCKTILLGLGGSATNDGGCGCAAALGVRFLDERGASFVPTGGTLNAIAAIDTTEARRRMQGVSLSVMCDIDNPMHGPTGAAFVFAPQKGADAETTALLDRRLQSLDQTFQRCLHRCVADIPGAGAAGAFGAGMMAFFDAQLRSGIETILDVVSFDDLLPGCDVVFTGEGRVDGQSAQGKVLSGVAGRARAHHVPVVVVAGGVAPEAEGYCADPESGVSALFSTVRQPMSFDALSPHSAAYYRASFDNILRLIALAEQFPH